MRWCRDGDVSRERGWWCVACRKRVCRICAEYVWGQGCDVGKSAMSGKSEISGEEWMRSWGIASLRMGIALCGVMVGIW